ncbi:flagellar assembly protein FliW [Bacillus coahuilensis m2-6]|uniref:flagellar assembly protein FliW n=1 Tax=Bacillus coahuilensis TaxID=408580 RepID=UPI0001851344|nr:flagellar assembly protein FliW [Bacillus coahuilensis]KUP05707.1 flagellar assembly protein FliW [Bacillus coahuilensis m2-6]
MNIQTKYHGELKIDPASILSFNLGIPGFPDETEFVLLPLPGNEQFAILQSIQSTTVGFVVTNPYGFFQDYEFQLDDSTKNQLELEGEANIQVFVILTVQNPFVQSTANLQAPVVINGSKRMGKQVILNDTSYQTKHALFMSTADKG